MREQLENLVFPQVHIAVLRKLPIRAINFDNPADKKQHDQLVSLVEQMLSLHRALPTQTDIAVRTLITRTLAATDAKIDALVYALYHLTHTEIDLVEMHDVDFFGQTIDRAYIITAQPLNVLATA